MKRWLVRIFAFLLLGAIVNVAVAWALEIAPRPSNFPLHNAVVGPVHIALWMRYAPDDMLSRTPIGQISETRHLGRDDLLMLAGDEDDPFMIIVRLGWPMRSLEGADCFNPDCDVVRTRTMRLCKPEWACQTHVSTLCTAPIWPGFAVNTVFYAGILWMLFAMVRTPFALRRRMRIKRGLCPKCSYDLRGRPVVAASCPECDKAVTA